MSINERHAFIIGASSGIGAAIAIGLANQSWTVSAGARRLDRLAEISAKNSNIKSIEMDVTDGDAVRRTIEDMPKIDVLVYAAGWNMPDREIDLVSTADWQHAFQINVEGAFHATQAVLPKMKQGGGGLIVYLSSISAEHPDKSGAAYQASKRALHGLAEATAFEEGPHGIRTTLIMPGLTRTEFNALRRHPPSEAERVNFLTPENVAGVIVFVCQLPTQMSIPYLTVVPTINPWNR